jgi:UDP-N-acetylglucosamine--N-acetylmuramyl-(pentapeptide) pyrophosphoryl-undecaprenol N-acetylglucosamine transferase
VPAAADEQRKIARRLAEAGAAIVVPNEDFTGSWFTAGARELLADPDRLTAMTTAVRTFAPGDTAHALADLVLRAATREEPISA